MRKKEGADEKENGLGRKKEQGLICTMESQRAGCILMGNTAGESGEKGALLEFC